MLELDFGQNTKVVGNILKYLCVKFGDVLTSFDRENPHWNSVEKKSGFAPLTSFHILANSNYFLHFIFYSKHNQTSNTICPSLN